MQISKPLVADFSQLLTIMDELREKCPWDKKQTLHSLRHLTIEEVYELSDSILTNDTPNIKNELGDVLLHIVFYSKIASENKDFELQDVIDNVCQKLIRRHPHIYGDVKVETEEDVKRNWEKIKLTEKAGKFEGVLSGVPNGLPAMVKAQRIQEKARGVGFDWENANQVWEKVEEEISEFRFEADPEKKEKEFGDILFALINYARFQNIDPEAALEYTNKKFITRFEYIEKQAKVQNKNITELNLNEMDFFWNEAKTKLV